MDGIADFGPIYVETHPGRFPVEPWATYTNLVFLALIVYWCWKLRGRALKHPLLTVSMPILAVGWASGTIYHATRSHPVWLFLDWFPIMILALLAAYWLWRELLGRPMPAVLLVLLPMLGVTALHTCLDNLSRTAHILIGYSSMALTIMFPAVWHCLRRHPSGCRWLAGAFAGFAVAITFRQLDLTLGRRLFPASGTHFLWHLFGGAAAFCLMNYIFTAGEKKHSVAAAQGNGPIRALFHGEPSEPPHSDGQSSAGEGRFQACSLKKLSKP